MYSINAEGFGVDTIQSYSVGFAVGGESGEHNSVSPLVADKPPQVGFGWETQNGVSRNVITYAILGFR